MPFIQYIRKRFNSKSEKIISQANDILAEYDKLGLSLTLRQLYYQFVSRDLIPNTFRSYKNLQNLVNDARLAGRMDWDSIEDRTRNLENWPTETDPESAIRKTAWAYRDDKWKNQPNHVEVWVEKDALSGVVEKACRLYETSFFSCRGYASQSEVWGASQRLAELEKPCYILHLSDHDPSGVDMTRDITERLELFEAFNVTVHRIALTMEQIRKHKPPPNPAKLTDVRSREYIPRFGSKSWELDALNPTYLIDLIQSETAALMDLEQWERDKEAEQMKKEDLHLFAERYNILSRFVRNEAAQQRFEEDEEDRELRD